MFYILQQICSLSSNLKKVLYSCNSDNEYRFFAVNLFHFAKVLRSFQCYKKGKSFMLEYLAIDESKCTAQPGGCYLIFYNARVRSGMFTATCGHSVFIV